MSVVDGLHRRLDVGYALEIREHRDSTGDRLLLIQVLAQAIKDSLNKHKPALKKDADRWLADDTRRYPGRLSFPHLCELLDYPPERIRRRIRENPREVYAQLTSPSKGRLAA